MSTKLGKFDIVHWELPAYEINKNYNLADLIELNLIISWNKLFSKCIACFTLKKLLKKMVLLQDQSKILQIQMNYTSITFLQALLFKWLIKQTVASVLPSILSANLINVDFEAKGFSVVASLIERYVLMIVRMILKAAECHCCKTEVQLFLICCIIYKAISVNDFKDSKYFCHMSGSSSSNS